MTAKIVFGATVLAGVAATAGLGAFRGDTPDLPHRADTRVAARTQPAADPEKPQPARGDGSAKKSPPAAGPTVNLERFRALTPGERMKLVERLSGDADPFTAAKRADLAASVTERGSVEPSNPAELVCRVKARDKDGPATTIKWLIDDGSMVKKGDRLAQLDDSRLREEFEAAKVKQQVAEAARVRAAENVRLAQQEGAVEVRLAEIDVKLAEVELKNAPSPKEKEVLELKAEQAKLRLERATVRSKGQVRLAEAELHARSAALEREVQRQRDIELEVRECVLLAPIGGIAVYHVPAPARFGAAVPVIAPGEPVREGQKLLRVVDLKQLAIGTRIHEAQVSTVRVGQAVQVRVDALPDKLFHGKVTQVSPVASAPDWQKSDVKVYPATIALDDPPPGLKPGMSVEVRIATADRKDVLQVPLKAVVGTGKGRTCFVKLGQEVVERSVVTGASDGRSVEIKEGLKEGDLVINDPPALLARP